MKETFNALMNTYTKDRYELVFAIKNKERPISDFEEDALNYIHSYYPQEEDPEGTVKYLVENMFGYSVLTPLLEDKTISDIKVHSWDRIIIKRKGKKSISDIKFRNEEQYKHFIDSVVTRNKINASNMNAIQRFTDKETFDDYNLRFTLVTPFLTTDKSYELVIRKHLKDFPEIEDLIDEEMLTPEVAEYLEKVKDEGSMIICGPMSSGKTTFLNALKEKIPYDKSVIVLQQAEELLTKNHPDMIFLHSIEGKSESDIHYDLKDLTIAALTLDVEYVIVGEIKGAEAAYLLNASNTGNICYGTIHSNSADTALDKIVDYALYSSSYTKKELLSMLSSFKHVVFIKDYKIKEIDRIERFNGEEIEYKAVYRL